MVTPLGAVSLTLPASDRLIPAEAAQGVPFEATVCHGPCIISRAHVLFQVLLAVQHLLADKHLQQAPAALVNVDLPSDNTGSLENDGLCKAQETARRNV